MGIQLTPVQRIVMRLVHRNARPQLRRVITKIHPADIATVLLLLPEEEKFRLVDVLFEERIAGKTLKELPESQLREVLDSIDDERLAEICQRLSPDDAADFLGHLSEERAQRILALVQGDAHDRIAALLGYPSDTAGGRMTSDYLALPETTSIGDALLALRKNRDLDNLFYVYVVDDEGVLRGVVALRQLVLQEPEVLLRDIMRRQVFKVKAEAPQEEVAHMIARYNLLAIPVVDESNRLLGIVTVDDVIDVIQEEATRDIYQLAGVDMEDRVFTSPFRSVRLRLPWLLVNLATAFLAASVVGLFENAIAQVAVLAVFMPVVAGMGGNAGTQTLAVVVRGLALGELDLKGAQKALFKEVFVGLVDGLTTGLVIALVVYLWKQNLYLALILASAQLINLIIAGFFGTLIPVVLRRLKLDPALASSVFLTTLTDVCGFAAFLGLATVFLRYLG